ncbi:MAG: branched-chain amino acid ABC transporter permease [Thermoproteota archaeon]|nr:MAG: branched-chain amino acid ABC transporter permease [Candidatus Korarchaeota archaeon]RLG51478.1 MAG: branched-chain amino acid ABC transporter permease [Candidatus Korarchaeota archaeon]
MGGFLSYFFAQLLNALIISAIYALMAVGLTLIFGIMKVINFAHGEMYMIGGYTAYFLITRAGVNPFAALAIAAVAGLVFGAVVERAFLRPMSLGRVERPGEYAILITFAISVFMRNLMIVLYPFSTGPPPYVVGKVKVGPLTIGGDRILASAVSIAVLAALLFFLYKTWPGRAMRAVSQNRPMASALGINPIRVDNWSFALGSMMAAVAGALMAPIFLCSPSMGAMPAIKGYVIIVLGGMGSILGSIVGSVLLGLFESLGSVFMPDPTRALAYRDVYGLLVLVAVLLLRPYGLFGEREREA